MSLLLRGARVFDGTRFHDGMAVRIADGRIKALLPDDGSGEDLGGGILAPGMIDLQVNGGDGVMLDGETASVGTIARICAAHARLGATGILPTLITDTAEATRAAIAAGIEAARAQTPGFLGLHLEGPHLDPRRAGAHDPTLIRAMDDNDLTVLIAAARALPALIVTLAPASVTSVQITALRNAGAIVSLGHAEATLADARNAQIAGATMVTHLFNAMSQISGREPGLAGAAITGDFDCGIIADGLHVHPQTLALALAAKTRGRAFLVSDAMAVAGTDLREFALNGRRILRADGRLTLADGTLAGADLTLPRAVQVMVAQVGITPERALAMATRIPAEIIGAAPERGVIAPGARADLVHLGDNLDLRRVWLAGAPVKGVG